LVAIFAPFTAIASALTEIAASFVSASCATILLFEIEADAGAASRTKLDPTSETSVTDVAALSESSARSVTGCTASTCVVAASGTITDEAATEEAFDAGAVVPGRMLMMQVYRF